MKKLLFILITLLSTFGFAQTYQTGTITLTFNDASRTGGFGSGGGAGRQIQTEVYYPATVAGSNVAVSSGSFPVVVIGHGFVMTWDSYDNIYSSLTKQGYIVALPRTEGGFSPSHNDFGLDEAVVANKLLQLNTTNTLAPIFIGKVVQKSAIGGHSMGGGASFLGASNNSSITCLFNFAAAQTNPRSSQAAKTITVPTLIIGGEKDCVAPSAANQNTMWDSTASSKKFEVVIKNITHCDFGNGINTNCVFGQNSSGCASTVTNTLALKLYMNFLNPFLAANLKNDCIEATRFMDSINLSQVIFSKKILGSMACVATGLSKYTINDRVFVYPNPTSEILNVELDSSISSGQGVINRQSSTNNYQLIIFNALGQLIQTTSTQQSKTFLNIKELNNGIYFLHIYKNTSLIETKKIIKE